MLAPGMAFAMGPPPPPTAADHDVIIVGASAAGLYAAFELNGMGFDVLVLDATGRHGGRVEPRMRGTVEIVVHACCVTGSTRANWHFQDIQNLDPNRLVWREPGSRVFTAPDGAPLRRSNFIRREWQPLLKTAELPMVGFNIPRHTMATDGLRKGLHAKMVQTRLGHSQIRTTLDIYSDAPPELDELAADLLDVEPEASKSSGTEG